MLSWRSAKKTRGTKHYLLRHILVDHVWSSTGQLMWIFLVMQGAENIAVFCFSLHALVREGQYFRIVYYFIPVTCTGLRWLLIFFQRKRYTDWIKWCLPVYISFKWFLTWLSVGWLRYESRSGYRQRRLRLCCWDDLNNTAFHSFH